MKYKLVCFDLDGTLLDIPPPGYSWPMIHDYLNIPKSLTKPAMNDFYAGKISYHEWCHYDISLMIDAGATRDKILDVFKGTLPHKGAIETIRTLKSAGIKFAIISGSIQLLIEFLPNKDLFDDILINVLEFDKKGNLTGVIPTKYDQAGKADGLRFIAEREGLNLSECVFVGDNDNDIEIAKTAGLSFAFNSKSEELDSVSSVVIKDIDLRSILPHILKD